MKNRVKSIVAWLVVMVVFLSFCAAANQISPKSHPTKQGWRLGVQAYTFKEFTFYEAIDKTAALGLHYIEEGGALPLSKETPDVRLSHTMPAELKEQVKQKLAAAGVKLVHYAAWPPPEKITDPAEWRRIFEFAKDMGVEAIVGEPPEEVFDVLEKLCQEYKIPIALHNHAKPARYWNPEKVLEACKGRSKWIGACADTGHWTRSGINPVEALKKLEGRIICLHLKDVNKATLEGHDVIWGTGKSNIKGILTELDRQNFEGVFSVEYEYNWLNSMPDIAQCIKYFDSVAAQLGQARWQWLFDLKEPTSWQVEKTKWRLEPDGSITPGSGGGIWTTEKFGDFILDLEFKVEKGANSGIFFRTDSLPGRHHPGAWLEVQVEDSYGKKPDEHTCGAFYAHQAPTKNMVKKPGQWNRMTLTCMGDKLYVLLNGEQVIEATYKDMPPKGYVGLQKYRPSVWYRNVRIKSL